MKLIFIATLLCTSALSPAIAAELDFDSTVSKVTVYPRGATVTRIASGKILAGDHVVIVDDLPGRILPNSLRVEGNAAQEVSIGSIDVRQIHVSSNDNAGERKEIEQKIELLNDDIAALSQKIANASTQRLMLQELAGRAVRPRNKDGVAVIISAEELDALFTLTGSRFAALSGDTENARIEIRELSKEIDKLNKKLAEASPRRELKSVVSINLNAQAEGDAEFKISYNVAEAGWQPLYDARLTLGDQGKNSKITLIRKASVRQATTDKWENIQLVLSTARPGGSTKAPELSPYVLSEIVARRNKRKKRRAVGGVVGTAAAPSPAMESAALSDTVADRKVAFKPVSVVFAGFLAEYIIPGNVTIANTGTQKNVTIATNRFDAEISAVSVPKTDQRAYLTAQFTVKSDAPLLPGKVSLTRDGIYLGQGNLPLLNNGEEHSLGFGRDDLVRIKRSIVTSKKGEAGFLSTVNVEERNFVTTIENLHDFPIKVTIKDQLPYPRHEDIEVEMLSYSTKPDERNVDKKRGVLAWGRNMKPGEKREIKFGYKVSWPKEMRITPVR